MKRIRTFIAVDLAPAVVSAAAELIDRLRSETKSLGIHWVEPEGIHITLKFLGEVSEAELADVCRGVTRACEPSGPLELRCGGLGVFPRPERPRTIWLGVAGRGVDGLKALQSRVEQEMALLGFPRELRRFEPHITLGRVRGSEGWADLAEVLDRFAQVDAGIAPIDEVVVYASRLSRGGPTYMPLSHIPLE